MSVDALKAVIAKMEPAEREHFYLVVMAAIGFSSEDLIGPRRTRELDLPTRQDVLSGSWPSR